MNRKCQHCSQLIADDNAGICPKCGTLITTDPISPVALSLEQENKLIETVALKLTEHKKIKKQINKAVFLWIFAGLGILGTIFGFSIWGTLNWVIHSTNVRLVQTDLLISNKIAMANQEMTNKIVNEFQTPRIKQTVESVAKSEAKQILETNVQPEVDRFRKDAEFLRVTTRARAYDFKAYQQLLDLAEQTNDNAYFSKQVLAEID